MLLLVGGFTTLYAALRAWQPAGTAPPGPPLARAAKERAMHHALLDALTHMLAGRFLRSRKSALAALAQEGALWSAMSRKIHAAIRRAGI